MSQVSKEQKSTDKQQALRIQQNRKHQRRFSNQPNENNGQNNPTPEQNKQEKQLGHNRQSKKTGQEILKSMSQADIEGNFEEIQKQKLKLLGIKSQEDIRAEIKRWKKLQKSIENKKKAQQTARMKKDQQENQKAEIQAKQKVEIEQAIKKQQIRRNLEQIQQRKRQREEYLLNQKIKMKRSKSIQHLPMYISRVKEFQMEEELRIKHNILKKKEQMMIDAEEIKEHQKKYMEHLKERLQKKEGSRRVKNNKSSTGKEGATVPHRRNMSQFNLFLHGDSQRKQKQLEKAWRRKRFEEKIRKMPVLIDQQKMKEALIAQDKSRNPLKYTYLSNVAALSDQKIYQEFKDFGFNIDSRQLGNQYMRQAASQTNLESRITKVHSESRLQAPKSQKIEYKNYLPEIRTKLRRSPDLGDPENQIQGVLHRYRNKSEQLSQLTKMSQIYQRQAFRKESQLQIAKGYRECLGKKQDVDDFFLKSLKMKIASVQLI